MTGAWANGRTPLPQQAAWKGTPPMYFYYLEKKGRRGEKLARKPTALATSFNNQIPVLLQTRTPSYCPLQRKPGYAWGWEQGGLSPPLEPQKWRPSPL